MNPPNVEAAVQLKNTALELAYRYGPKVATALLILFIGGFISRRLSKVAERWLSQRNLEPTIHQILKRMIGLFVFLIFLLMALQNLGIELLPLVASLGIVGVGAGLALQGMMSNLFAGLTIIFTRPFRVGDYIAAIGVEGQVHAIELFSTILVHSDRSHVVIPNRKLIGEVLHNYGKIRQLDLAVGVAYSTDLDRAVALIRQTIGKSPRVLSEPAAFVGVTTLGESAVCISVRPWVRVPDYVDAIGELNQSLIAACRQERVELAFPQREIRILSGAASA